MELNEDVTHMSSNNSSNCDEVETNHILKDDYLEDGQEIKVVEEMVCDENRSLSSNFSEMVNNELTVDDFEKEQQAEICDNKNEKDCEEIIVADEMLCDENRSSFSNFSEMMNIEKVQQVESCDNESEIKATEKMISDENPENKEAIFQSSDSEKLTTEGDKINITDSNGEPNNENELCFPSSSNLGTISPAENIEIVKENSNDFIQQEVESIVANQNACCAEV